MSARGRKLRADLWGNKGRSMLAVLSLAVGTMAVGGIHLAASTVDASFEASFLAADPPSAVLETDPFPAGLVDELAAHPEVGEAEARHVLRVRASTASGDLVDVELVAMDDFDDNQVARIVPKQGRWPPGDGAVVLEQASLPELGARIGDDVAVRAGGGTVTQLGVVGTAFDVYEMAPTLGGPIRGYVSSATMSALGGTEDPNVLYLRAAADPLDREQAIAMASAVRDDVLQPAGVAIEVASIQEPSEHRGDRALSFLVLAMQLLSVLAAVIAVALVVNTVAAVLVQQRRQIGVLKAVGATSGQLTVQYLAYVVSLSAVALVVSIPLSLVLGRFLAGFLAELANFELDPLTLPWSSILLQVGLAVALPVLAVAVALRRATGATVQEIIADRGLTAITPPRIRGAAPVSRPTLLALRNATRSRSRLVLTVATLGVCGAVIVGVLSTKGALDRLTDQVAGYHAYDLELSLTEPAPADEVIAAFEDDSAVAGVEGWLRGQAFRLRPDGTENENISITGVPTGSRSIEPTLTEGRWFDAADDHPIVINSHFADEEDDLVVGGEVELDIAGDRRMWRIVGESTTTLVGPVAYVPAADVATAIGEPGRADVFVVQLRPGVAAADAVDRVEALASAAGLPIAGIQTSAQLRASVDELVAVAVALLLLVGGVLAVVAVIGVTGTMTLGIIEQTREIGVLRTLGASSWAVRRMLLVQGIAVAVAGTVTGVLLSLPLALVLRSVLVNDLLSAPLPRVFSWTGVAIWVAVALLIGIVGTVRPSRLASRLTVRDTLAYE